MRVWHEKAIFHVDCVIALFSCEQLAHFKVPRYWKFAADFPMTVTGKVQKFKMREAAIAELGLASAAAIRTA